MFQAAMIYTALLLAISGFATASGQRISLHSHVRIINNPLPEAEESSFIADGRQTKLRLKTGEDAPAVRYGRIPPPAESSNDSAPYSCAKDYVSVCYAFVGCFDCGRQSEKFFYHEALPSPPEVIAPQFHYYYALNDSELANFTSVVRDHFDVDYFNLTSTVGLLEDRLDKELFVLIHGYRDDEYAIWLSELQTELLDQGYDVLTVGWANGSMTNNYYEAAANARVVGAIIARVLERLEQLQKTKLSLITVVGHSLGAHIAGFAGARLNQLYRIIGLDPAGPIFGGFPKDIHPDARLDPTDAEVVQVIHTNGASLFAGGFGQLTQLGHVDFYPNGGISQAGCKSGFTSAFARLFSGASQFFDRLGCSHNRAQWLFLEMVRKARRPTSQIGCQFYGFPGCANETAWLNGDCFDGNSNASALAVPGLHIGRNYPYSGKYYFNTLPENSTSGEFCASQFRLELIPAEDTVGALEIRLDSKNGDVVTVEISRQGETIFANESIRLIFVAPWGFDIQTVTLLYQRYVPAFYMRWRRSSGLETASFSRLEISRYDQKRFATDEAVGVRTNQPETLQVIDVIEDGASSVILQRDPATKALSKEAAADSRLWNIPLNFGK